jgi:hypothetical protein
MPREKSTFAVMDEVKVDQKPSLVVQEFDKESILEGSTRDPAKRETSLEARLQEVADDLGVRPVYKDIGEDGFEVKGENDSSLGTRVSESTLGESFVSKASVEHYERALGHKPINWKKLGKYGLMVGGGIAAGHLGKKYLERDAAVAKELDDSLIVEKGAVKAASIGAGIGAVGGAGTAAATAKQKEHRLKRAAMGALIGGSLGASVGGAGSVISSAGRAQANLAKEVVNYADRYAAHMREINATLDDSSKRLANIKRTLTNVEKMRRANDAAEAALNRKLQVVKELDDSLIVEKGIFDKTAKELIADSLYESGKRIPKPNIEELAAYRKKLDDALAAYKKGRQPYLKKKEFVVKELDDSLIVEKGILFEVVRSSLGEAGRGSASGGIGFETIATGLTKGAAKGAPKAAIKEQNKKKEKAYMPEAKTKRIALAKRNILETATGHGNAKLNLKPTKAKELDDSIIVEKGIKGALIGAGVGAALGGAGGYVSTKEQDRKAVRAIGGALAGGASGALLGGLGGRGLKRLNIKKVDKKSLKEAREWEPVQELYKRAAGTRERAGSVGHRKVYVRNEAANFIRPIEGEDFIMIKGVSRYETVANELVEKWPQALRKVTNIFKPRKPKIPVGAEAVTGTGAAGTRVGRGGVFDEAEEIAFRQSEHARKLREANKPTSPVRSAPSPSRSAERFEPPSVVKPSLPKATKPQEDLSRGMKYGLGGAALLGGAGLYYGLSGDDDEYPVGKGLKKLYYYGGIEAMGKRSRKKN